MNKVLVLVKVLGTGGLYAYPCCSTCHRKVRKPNDQDGRLWCSVCLKYYSSKYLHYRYHVNLTVSDSSGIARVTIFGKSLKTFFGLTATEFCRYLIRCEKKNDFQRLDLDQLVHLAMEKCLTGSMVYLTFGLTANSATSASNYLRFCTNVLPASKATCSKDYCKIPELLANGICKVQSEKEDKSIVDVFTEYCCQFEKTVKREITNNSSADDSSHLFERKEDATLLDEAHCSGVLSPRNLRNVSSHVNILELSMMSNGNDSNLSLFNSKKDQGSICFLKDGLVDKASSTEFDKLRDKSLTLGDLEQSFCCSTTNDASIWTSIRDYSLKAASFDSVKSALVPEIGTGTKVSTNLSILRIDSNRMKTKNTCNNETSDPSTSLTPNVKSAHNEFDLFDSPTSEDLDAFLAQVSFTWLSRKPEQMDSNLNNTFQKEGGDSHGDTSELSSNWDVCCSLDPETFVTSTPMLENRGQVHPEFSTPLDIDLNSINYGDTPVILTTTESQRQRFELGLPSTPISLLESISHCLCSSKSRKSRPSCNSLSKKKGKHKSKNMWRCVLSGAKSCKFSKDSPSQNVANVSLEKSLPVLQHPKRSLVSCRDMPLSQNTTPVRWTQSSLLLCEDESIVHDSKEEGPTQL